MTSDGVEVTVMQHSAIDASISDATDIFIYDTTKDSDLRKSNSSLLGY